MTYDLFPLNEGQSMNASTLFTGSKADAIYHARWVALTIAGALPNCSISVAVCTPDENPEAGQGIIVLPDGRTVKP